MLYGFHLKNFLGVGADHAQQTPQEHPPDDDDSDHVECGHKHVAAADIARKYIFIFHEKLHPVERFNSRATEVQGLRRMKVIPG